MTNKKFSDKLPDIEQIKHEPPMARRQSDRRLENRRHSAPKLFAEDEIKALRGTKKDEELTPRVTDRRKSQRRASKPRLLDPDEIVKLRYKPK